jgi:hypothetical protein
MKKTVESLMDVPVNNDSMSYLLHRDADGPMIWVRGVRYSTEDLREILQMVPEEFFNRLKKLQSSID